MSTAPQAAWIEGVKVASPLSFVISVVKEVASGRTLAGRQSVLCSPQSERGRAMTVVDTEMLADLT